MTKFTTVAFRNALRFAAVSVGGLAEEAGYSPVTWDLYLNRRPPSRGAAFALAAALEQRAQRLRSHAERLRAAAEDEARGARG